MSDDKEVVRITLMGSQVGKTRMVMRLLHDDYRDDDDPTLEVCYM